MKSTGSVVTYLLFEFLIPARYTYRYTCAQCTLCMKMHCYFLLNIKHGASHFCGGRPPNTTLRPQGDGPPSGGLQLSSADTVGNRKCERI